MIFRRVIYFGYYIKKLDISMLRKFLRYTSANQGKSKIFLFIDMMYSSFCYNISLLEYFQFGFPNQDRASRKNWAGTGYMYEYQKYMNPSTARDILDDKTKFSKKYAQFIKHKVVDLGCINLDEHSVESLIPNDIQPLVFKVADGKCGKGLQIKNFKKGQENSIKEFMNQEGYDLVEEFIWQHEKLSQLSPTGVNTIRIFSQLNSMDQVEILGCRLRISVDSVVDNMAAGNLAAPIDERTGVVNGPGVYSDITKPSEDKHPITGVQINGFEVPFWEETINLIKEVTVTHPQNRSIGWDIAMTESGPDLIEGNHDWCKLVWQMPVKKGLKPVLERHIKEHKLIMKGK